MAFKVLEIYCSHGSTSLFNVTSARFLKNFKKRSRHVCSESFPVCWCDCGLKLWHLQACFSVQTQQTLPLFPLPDSVFYFPGYCHRHLGPPANRSPSGNPLQADRRSLHPGNHHYHTRHSRVNIRRTLDRQTIEPVPILDTRPGEWLWSVRRRREQVHFLQHNRWTKSKG